MLMDKLIIREWNYLFGLSDFKVQYIFFYLSGVDSSALESGKELAVIGTETNTFSYFFYSLSTTQVPSSADERIR